MAVGWSAVSLVLVVVLFLCFIGVLVRLLVFYIGLTELVAFLLIPCSPCAHFFLHRLLHRRIAVCNLWKAAAKKGAGIAGFSPGACIKSRCL